MSVPGIGSVVLMHVDGASSRVEVPAVVAVTHDSWISDGGDVIDGYAPAGQPGSNQAYIQTVGNPSGDSYRLATFGTGSLEFSVPDVQIQAV